MTSSQTFPGPKGELGTGSGLTGNGPINVFMDNNSVIALANNPVFYKRSKHIDFKYHWLRHKVSEEVV